jgi:hypothetical protein
MVSANPFMGVAMHAIGAFFAATCYTPQKQVKGWSWQTYWITQASVCWLILPTLGAILTIPDLLAVLREAPSSAMYTSFLLGAGYGIGGTAFGIAIRYIGFSLTYGLPAEREDSRLPMNFALATVTGFCWYGQFFFYNLATSAWGDISLRAGPCT